VVYFGQLGLDGRLLASEFTPPLHDPVPDIYLPSAGSHLPLLLMVLQLLKLEPSVWLWCGDLQQDRWYGQRHWNALRR
jgi:hypothetical protein